MFEFRRLRWRTTPTEGYLLLAFGAQKYADLAMNCAISIRAFEEQRRPIVLAKLRCIDISRFDKTLFVDADTLLLKAGIDDHWKKLDDYDFAIPAERAMTSGEWWGADIGSLISAAGAGYVVKMNSGSIYFKKTPKGRAVFRTALDVLRRHRSLVKGTHRDGVVGNEIFFGLAMGLQKTGLYPLIDPQIGSLMLSTIGAKDIHIDDNVISYIKFGETVSPHFVHFCGLQPDWLYEDRCQYCARLLNERRPISAGR
jgi:hypothetical protein